MTDFLAPWSFRFRGRTGRILAIVDCFLKEPNKGLAPTHIGKQAGLPIYDVIKILNKTPELFIKLPGRGDGITRYRLASSAAVRGQQAIEALVRRHARRESWLFYALMLMVMLLFVVAVLVISPALL